jgi:hypothetical protein
VNIIAFTAILFHIYVSLEFLRVLFNLSRRVGIVTEDQQQYSPLKAEDFKPMSRDFTGTTRRLLARAAVADARTATATANAAAANAGGTLGSDINITREKVQNIAYRGLGHAVTSSIGLVLFVWDPISGGAAYVLLMVLGMHFWFNVPWTKFGNDFNRGEIHLCRDRREEVAINGFMSHFIGLQAHLRGIAGVEVEPEVEVGGGVEVAVQAGAVGVTRAGAAEAVGLRRRSSMKVLEGFGNNNNKKRTGEEPESVKARSSGCSIVPLQRLKRYSSGKGSQFGSQFGSFLSSKQFIIDGGGGGGSKRGGWATNNSGGTSKNGEGEVEVEVDVEGELEEEQGEDKLLLPTHNHQDEGEHHQQLQPQQQSQQQQHHDDDGQLHQQQQHKQQHQQQQQQQQQMQQQQQQQMQPQWHRSQQVLIVADQPPLLPTSAPPRSLSLSPLPMLSSSSGGSNHEIHSGL